MSFQNVISTTGFFTWRRARRVVFVYTRPDETIIDFEADLQLRDAAASAGRGNLAITEPAEIADLDRLDRAPSLVVMRWRPATPDRPSDIAGLVTARRLILASRSSTCSGFDAGSRSGWPGAPF